MRLSTLSITLLTVAIFSGCTASNRPTQTAAPIQTRSGEIARRQIIREAAITTVAEVEGKTMIEIPLGSANGVEVGTFFRVITTDTPPRIKGLLQVTEIISEQRAVARVVTLTDRADLPKPGDLARELTVLADIGAGIENTARTGEKEKDAIAIAEDERFNTLRRQYQRLLAEEIARRDSEVEELRRNIEAKISVADQAHQRDIEAKATAERAAIEAAKVETAQNTRQQSSAEREAALERARRAAEERDAMRVQIDGLLTAQQALHRRIETLVSERAEVERNARAQVRAESETREQLAARLAELERHDPSHSASTAALLTRDPNRDEGVLERVNRLRTEAAEATERAQRAQASADEAQAALLDSRRRLSELEAARDAALAQAAGKGEVDRHLLDATTELEQARRLVAGARERLDAAELARLESERSMFDLAARVLRLPGRSPELDALRDRLRAIMAARAASDAAANPEAAP